MYDNVTLEKINLLINFQRNFKFLKKEVDMMNNKLTFFKDILLDFLQNLI